MPRLLLADDSVAIQRLVELTFAHEKMDVTTVGDGEAAIASITAHPPDIVLADIGMPKRSGYEVAAFVKDEPRLAKIPVLLLAGAFEPVDEGQAAQVRCDGVLVKPFEPQQVIARVRELLGGAVGTPTRATAAVPRPVDRLTTPLKLVGPQLPKP
ncbi:MAG TPA: response regulator, partial [Vicinamibacterales bacterium]|nr:response regulator [Vicinamibacterales bacterium]